MTLSARLSVVATLVVALAVAASGCDKKKDAAGGGAGGAAAAKTLSFFPKESRGVGSIKVSRIQQSPLYKSFAPKLLAMSGGDKHLDEIKANCGFDPVAAVTEVTIGGDPDADKGVVVVTGVDRAALKKCAELMSQKHGHPVTVTAEGEYDKLVGGDHGDKFIYWAGDKTFVAGPEKKEELQTVVGGKGSVAEEPNFMALLGKVDTNADIWAVFKPDAKMVSSLPIKPQTAFFSISLDKGFDLKLGLGLESDAAAKEWSDKINAKLKELGSSQFGSFTKGVKVGSNGADLRIDIFLDTAQVEQLASFVPMAMQMLQQQMGGGGGMGDEPEPTEAPPAEAPPAGTPPAGTPPAPPAGGGGGM
jgi:hypothetical protein